MIEEFAMPPVVAEGINGGAHSQFAKAMKVIHNKIDIALFPAVITGFIPILSL